MNALDHLAARLAEHPEIIFAHLFGSRGRGDARPDSDWDVAVYLDPALADHERFKLRCRLAAELDDLGEVDVVVLNDAPPLLAHRALMGRRVLVRDPISLVRYQVRTLARSEDERHWRELNWQALRSRIKEGRFGRS
ncbi:MAG: nucleotidyltransferase domain-containing protein [Thermoanaerobaculia bacterium]